MKTTVSQRDLIGMYGDGLERWVAAEACKMCDAKGTRTVLRCHTCGEENEIPATIHKHMPCGHPPTVFYVTQSDCRECGGTGVHLFITDVAPSVFWLSLSAYTDWHNMTYKELPW